MADVSKITLPNGSTYDIKDTVARNRGNTRIFSADCSTAAATQQKDVTITECTELIAGDVFVITFTNAQTYNGAPTMQINSLGAKNIRRVTGTNAGRYEWNDGEVVVFKWTGTYFVITTGGTASTTYYGRTKLYSGAGSYSSALALAPISMYNMANRSICPYYSASATYAVGDKVRYNDYIYECITAITTAENWTAAHWQIAPTLQEQMTALNSNLNTEWFQRLQLGYLMESRVEGGAQVSTINNFFNGLTYVSSTSQGAPADYCIVLAFSVASYVVQFAVQVYTTNIWLRSGSTDGNTWSAWKLMIVS